MKLLKNYILATKIKEEEKTSTSVLYVVDGRQQNTPRYKVEEIGKDVENVKVGDIVILVDSFTNKLDDKELFSEDSVVAIV